MYSRREHSSRGAAAVEFAIVVPLLLLILLGLIDFGRMFYVQVSLNAASREGARASALGRTAAQVTQVVQASSPDTASLSSLGATSTLAVPAPGACPAAPTATSTTAVTVSVPFTWILPVGLLQFYDPGSSRADTFTLDSRSEMLCVG
jgi:Flp pilus assembly protein TadG